MSKLDLQYSGVFLVFCVLRVLGAFVMAGLGRCDVSRLAFDGYEVAVHGYISTKESAFSVKKRKRGGVDFWRGARYSRQRKK